jgi:hypothetical protein
MLKRYVYKNVNGRPVNIGGYQFREGQELESDVSINGFNEAVSNGFLELFVRSPDDAEPGGKQGVQTGGGERVKIIFHMGTDSEGGEILKEVESDPNIPIDFFSADLTDMLSREDEVFDCWFKDAEFTKPVKLDKARSPKDGEIHFYGKYSPKPEDPHILPDHDETAKPDGDAGDPEKDGALPPSPSIDDETAIVGSESE